MTKKDENKLWLAHDTRQSFYASIMDQNVCKTKRDAQALCKIENGFYYIRVFRVVRVEIKEIKR